MAEKKKKKPGRPFLPKDQAKKETVTVRLQPGERGLIEELAKKDGITLSEWVRRALNSALDKARVLL